MQKMQINFLFKFSIKLTFLLIVLIPKEVILKKLEGCMAKIKMQSRLNLLEEP